MYSIIDMIEADRPLLTHKTHKEINPLSKIEDFNISTQLEQTVHDFLSVCTERTC